MEQILCINSNREGMTDPHVEMVQEKLPNDIQIVTYDPSLYPVEPVSYEVGRDGAFRMDTPNLPGIEGDKIKAVWYRKPRFLQKDDIEKYIDSTDKPSAEYAAFCYRAYKNMAEMVMGSYSNLPWVSDYWAIQQANNRITNLQQAFNVGFTIPETVITSDPSKAFDFYIENKQDVVTKSIQVERIMKPDDRVLTLYATPLPKGMTRDRFNGLNHNPVIFQERIEKATDIRVTVIGDKVYACEIETITNELDWRKKNVDITTTFIKHELPENVQDMCLRLVKNLGLKFGALDFAITKKGQYVYFECNPNGQWGFCELKAGLPISEGFAEYFAKI